MKKFIFLLIFLSSCTQQNHHITQEALGTVCSVYLPENDADVIGEDIFQMLSDLENKMSKHIEGSDIYKINNSQAGDFVRVSDETCFLIKESFEYSRRSEALFDITIGPLIKEWGFGYDEMKVPEKASIKKALGLINYKDILLSANNSVSIKKPGMMLDLGAIAKGFAADKAVEILRNKGVSTALLDFGGNIYAFGKKPDKSSWKIGIQDPFDLNNSIVGILKASDKAIVTSGTYQRFFIEDDIKYHHILDPQTGAPSEKGLLSVTIISESATQADALSTTVFLLGLEKGLKLLKETENVDGIIIDKNKNVFLSDNFKSDFKITNQNYNLKN